jgi:flagellin
LAISEKMRGQIRGLKQAQRNAQDGISLIQTAEGALNEIHAILQRMRELATQSATDTNTDVDRHEIQKEINQLAEEINRIAETTEFNTQNLLGGEFSGTFHIGANESQNILLSINAMDADALAVAGDAAGVGIETSAKVTAAIADFGIEDGKSYNVEKLEQAVDIDGTEYEYVLTDSEGVIYGVSEDGSSWEILDTANDTANAGNTDIKSVVLTNAKTFNLNDPVISGKIEVSESAGDITLTGQATLVFDENSKGLASGDYNVVDGKHVYVASGHYGLTNSKGELVAYSVDGETWTDLEGNALFTVSNANALTNAGDVVTVSGGGGIDVSSQEAADKAITTINDAIETVSAERSKLGAYQNRLEHTIANLGTSAENLQAAESRIRDLDMAEEIMAFTKNNILQQAATAMLAQANMAPQSVLQLLG